MKKIIFILGLICLISFGSLALADSINFDDINDSHWAHEAVHIMTQKGILAGYPDGSFKPDAAVSRAEFAKIMVKALALNSDVAAAIQFSDVAQDDWSTPYINAAQQYLTGYKKGDLFFFKPNLPAKREDMAVALVKALKYPIGGDDALANFADDDEVSNNLKPYVAAAVKHGLIKGYQRGAKNYINPQGNLTRAETSQLLYNMTKSLMKPATAEESEEKIVLQPSDVAEQDSLFAAEQSVQKSDVKVDQQTKPAPEQRAVKANQQTKPLQKQHVVNDERQTTSTKKPKQNRNNYPKPLPESPDTTSHNPLEGRGEQPLGALTLKVSETSKGLSLDWNALSDKGFKYYKIVASTDDSTPQYPENGYAAYIGDANQTHYTVRIGDYYNNGDFDVFKAGNNYYFAITGVYGDDRMVTSPGVEIQFPEIAEEEPKDAMPDDANTQQPPFEETEPNGTVTVDYEIVDHHIKLNWNVSDKNDLIGYKVVASKRNPAPVYPGDGYFKYISDPNETQAIVDSQSYNDGDFTKFERGESYYFAITALYKNGKIASPSLKITFPELPNQAPSAALKVKAVEAIDGIELKWNKLPGNGFRYYKIVASVGDSAPQYPENGYANYISDIDTTNYTVKIGDYYNGGDFKVFAEKQAYYFAITAVYENGKISSPALYRQLPELPHILPIDPVDEEDEQPLGSLKLAVSETSEGLNLNWNALSDRGFYYYKVVASVDDSTPQYPENGYATYISDADKTHYTVKIGDYYNSGDFAAFKADKAYYFAITAVYDNDKKVTSNVVYRTLSGE